MRRVAIIGSSGAGKSTLAITLSQRIDLPLHHLDRLYWKPHWVETPRDEFRAMQRKIVAQEKWIIDGNYNSTLDERLPFADTILFLDYPRIICLFRVLKRQILYRKKKRPDINEDCQERLSREFLRWVWNFPREGRVSILNHLKHLEHNPTVVTFTGPKELSRWLSAL